MHKIVSDLNAFNGPCYYVYNMNDPANKEPSAYGGRVHNRMVFLGTEEDCENFVYLMQWASSQRAKQGDK